MPPIRYTRLLSALLLPLLLAILAVGTTRTASAVCGVSFPASVAGENELNAAISCFNSATTAGTYTLTLTADIDLTGSTTAIDNATDGVALVIEGGGYTVDGYGSSARAFSIATNTHVTITSLTVRGRSSSGSGGAILNAGILSFQAGTIQNSEAGQGGGLYNTGSLTITQSLLSGNRADGAGGGGLANAGQAVVLESTFKGNWGDIANGGALANAGSMEVSNSTFSGNWADSNGGSLHNTGALTLTNSTVTNNFASGSGNIYNQGSLYLRNSLVANTSAGGDCINNGGTVTAAYTLIEDSGNACGLINGADGNITGQDPLLGALADNGGSTQTHALGAGSPAIDAGDNALAVDTNGDPFTTDQRGSGYARIINGTVDIGAYESTCPLFPKSVSDKNALNEAIACFNAITAAGSYTISLTGDIDLTASTTAIDNPTDGVVLVIEGGGFTVDGQGTSGVRPFEIAADTDVTMNEVTVTGGNVSGNGGGILNSGTLTITASTITGNQAQNGGGLYHDGSDLTMTNVTLSHNSASYAGSNTGRGGALYNGRTSPHLSFVTVYSNTASNYGGGIYNYGSVSQPSLQGMIIWGNAPTGIHEPVYNDEGAEPTISYSIIEDAFDDVNGVWNSYLGTDGGGNSDADPLLGALADNGDETQTHALDAGSPAIDLVPYGVNGCGTTITTDQRGESRLLTLSCDAGAYEALDVTPLCFVESNGDADTDFAGDAGAVQAGIDAVAYGGGSNGAVKVAGTCTGVSATESLTQTGYISTGVSLSGGYTITNWLADADPNTYPTTLDANGSGRVLYVTGSQPVTVTGLIITGGDAGGGGNGGGIFASNSAALTLDDSTLQSNSASSGGGLFALNAITVTNSAFVGNSADSGGGMMGFVSVVISNTSFISNTADSGGGLNVPNGSLSLSGVTFQENSATDAGGGLIATGSAVTVESSNFISNQAQSGGGLHLPTGVVSVNDTAISMNSASEFGGGLYLTGSDVTITDSSILSNTAGDDGGGIYRPTGNFTFRGNSVRGNSADGLGGGLILYTSATLEQSTIADNSASIGGGVYTTQLLTVLESTISGNSADEAGGGIFTYGSLTSLESSTLSGNQVLTDTANAWGGGGLAVASNSGVETRIVYSTIADNSAPNLTGKDGIAITGTLAITGSIVSGNGSANCTFDGSVSVVSGGYNVENGDSCGLGGAGDLANTDPLLAALADNPSTGSGQATTTQTHALGAGSPAIDIIPAGSCTVSTDQRGAARPADGNGDGNAACDAGAFEAYYPEIDVRGLGQSIPSGDDSPSPSDDTDFGAADVGGAAVAHTFTISNTGSTTLTLTASPAVSLADGSHFSVSAQPGSSEIAPGSAATFDLSFAPTAQGIFTDTVTIASDDADEPSYTFVVDGIGCASENVLRVDRDAIGAESGASWTDAFTRLQDALAVADACDAITQIWVAEGVYYPDEGVLVSDDDRSASFAPRSGVALYGGFNGTESSLGERDAALHTTVLSGDIDGNDTTDATGVVTDTANLNGSNAYHVFLLDGSSTPITGTTVIDGFTITAGQANGSLPDNRGGAILCDAGGSGGECSPAISNVTFSGNSAQYGGAVSALSGLGGVASPAFSAVVFDSNLATRQGGALFLTAADNAGSVANPSLANVTFRDNSSDIIGGAVYIYSDLGGSSTPSFTDALFSNNSAQAGGAIYSEVDVAGVNEIELTNAIFENNSTTYTGAGGAIYTEAYGGGEARLNVTNATFDNNSADAAGGAIYNDGYDSGSSVVVTLTDVILSGNTSNLGGAVANFSEDSGSASVILQNVTLSGNEAGQGGAIYNEGTDSGVASTVLSFTTVYSNTASNDGGAIYTSASTSGQADISMAGSILWANSAGGSGDAIYNDDAFADPNTLTTTVSYSVVEGSGGSASWDSSLGTDGGGNSDADPLLDPLADNGGSTQTHALQSGSPAIDFVPYGAGGCGTTITGDQRGESRLLTLSCDAGAYESQSVVASCFVESNGDAATDFAGDAGAVQAGIDAVAYGGGSNGAVKVAGTCTGVSATESLNQTGYISTGLSLSGGYTITNWLAAADPDTYPTTLDADGAGRVLYITGTLPVTVTGLIITGGYWDVIENSLVPGGGIYAAASSVAITDSQILSNTAFSSPLVEPLGGGLYHAAGTLVLSNLEVGYNAATGTYRGRGGALYSAGESVTVVDSTFLNNTSDAKGGALYTTGALIVTDSTFTGNNSSNDDGGALFHNGSSGIISGSTFRQNRSEFTGGALSLDGDEFTIQNSLFEENSAYYDGGAIAKWGGTLHISDSVIRQNTVDVYTGGGIVNSAGSMILESSAIVSNTAPLVGGGILNGYDNGAPASLTLINSTVSGNQVTTATVDTYYGGGGIGHWTDDSSSLTIRYSTIANNSAPNLDGRDGLYVNGAVTVTGSIIAGNGTQNCAGNSATYTSEGYNLEDVDTCGFDTTGDQPNTDPLLGTLAEEGDTFVYIPAKSSPAVDIIPVGAAGCAVAYATDQQGVARPQNLYCDSGSVEITNQTPTAGDDSYSTGADEALTILTAGVLANDSDPDGDSLSALLSAPPTNGSLALNSDGSFVYTPTVGFAGVDRFTYAASDGNLRASAEVTIAVGSATVPDIPLSGPAWNLFGWPLQASYAISEGLASIDGSYATVYGYTPDDGSDPWKVYDTSLPGVLNDLTRFEFGHGYWISTTQSVTVTLSTLGSSRLAGRFDGSLPPPPATLWGRNDGGDREVTVTIDGVVCGTGKIAGGWYRVHVATDVERPGCGANGRTVTVQAGDVTRSLAWPGAGVHRVALTPSQLFLPSVQAGGVRTPAPSPQAEVEYQLHLPSVGR